nr:DNA helicase INO80 isoform X1 [Ipomoea batatas]
MFFIIRIENHAEHGGTLNEHQLNRLHAILKPFMLRRVKKDVVSELTGKTEITVHCKLSSRQQAFYQAIKNKISLAELFDSSRGHLNEKKIMNLMNIVIQLRKVCNHPELFERNEGSSYFYFGQIQNSLLPPPFGELEDVYYSGGRSPVTYQVFYEVHLWVLCF